MSEQKLDLILDKLQAIENEMKSVRSHRDEKNELILLKKDIQQLIDDQKSIMGLLGEHEVTIHTLNRNQN